MLFTCYCANSREIASPQVNWSEANDNVRACEIVTSSIFLTRRRLGTSVPNVKDAHGGWGSAQCAKGQWAWISRGASELGR